MNTKTNALLTLFNAIQVNEKKEQVYEFNTLSAMVKNGFIVEPLTSVNDSMIKSIISVIGIGGEKLNSSFHKSWNKIKKASDAQLFIEQMVHYITTYGFESLGIYDSNLVYIPNEKLELPEKFDNIPLVVIRCLTSEEILNEIVNIGSAGIALSQTTLDNIMTIIKDNKYDSGFISEIQNRELRTLLFDYYDITPTEPVAYLRYVISKLTGESLVIKNHNLINKLKVSDSKLVDKLISSAPKNLATIFFRYKPLFLAMKTASTNKTFFNNLRKSANKQHVPMPEDYMNSITGKIKNGEFKISVFKKELKKYFVWRKVRLAYALNNRLVNLNSIVYRVRNGKGWVSDFSDNLSESKIESTKKALNEVLSSIAEDISMNVEGKKFYIPSYVHYALPASEKQFVGNLPANTSVSVEKDLVVAIHWYNNENHRIDLDYSLMDVSGKFGWDARHRSDERDIMFSGDVTNAPRPNGATELFYLSDKSVTEKLVTVNYFNYTSSEPVEDCKLVVAKINRSDIKNNYMIDPNKVLISQNVKIDKKQNTLGLITKYNDENRVYFLMTSVGNSISVGSGEREEKIREFLLKTSKQIIDLKDIIELAGGEVVEKQPKDNEYVDLSPEALDKNTIIGLFS